MPFDTDKVIVHKDFNGDGNRKFVNDIAMVRVNRSRPLQRSSLVDSVCLPQGQSESIGDHETQVEMVGYGLTNTSIEIPDTPYRGRFSYVPNACNSPPYACLGFPALGQDQLAPHTLCHRSNSLSEPRACLVSLCYQLLNRSSFEYSMSSEG